MLISVLFFYTLFVFLFFLFSFLFVRVYISYTPDVFLELFGCIVAIRDGIPQLVGTVSLTYWYCRAHYFVLVCNLPSRCIFVTACLVTTGSISGK